jgi:ribosomal protein S27AE
MNAGRFFIERVPAMNREFEDALMASYPAIYRCLKPRFSGGCLFECDDGWYRIIDELSCKLEVESWRSHLVAIEVREKLGSLRLRLRGDITGAVNNWLTEAARLSQRTCERCGQPAALRGHEDGRVRTLCPTCAAAMGYVVE